jgi:hypothetical protein
VLRILGGSGLAVMLDDRWCACIDHEAEVSPSTSFGPRNIPKFETVTRHDVNFQLATASTRMGHVRALNAPKYHDATTSQCR